MRTTATHAAPQAAETTDPTMSGQQVRDHIAMLRRKVPGVTYAHLADAAKVKESTLALVCQRRRDALDAIATGRVLAVTPSHVAAMLGYLPASAAAEHVRRMLATADDITIDMISKTARVSPALVTALAEGTCDFVAGGHAARLTSLQIRRWRGALRVSRPEPRAAVRRVPVGPSREHITCLTSAVYPLTHAALAEQIGVHPTSMTPLMDTWTTVSARLEQRILALAPADLADRLGYVPAGPALGNLRTLLHDDTDTAARDLAGGDVTVEAIAAAAGISPGAITRLLQACPDYIAADTAAALTAVTAERASARPRTVPATDTVEHLRHLLKAVPAASPTSIDRAAGLTPGTTRSILSRQTHVRPHTRDKIKNLTSGDLADYIAAPAAAAPAAANLARLTRRGWSVTDLAAITRLSPATLRTVLAATEPDATIPSRVVDAVGRAASQIGDRPGPHTSVPASRARRLARSVIAQGWSIHRIAALVEHPPAAVRTLVLGSDDTCELGLAAGVTRLARCLESARYTPGECAARHGWRRLAAQFARHAPGAGPVQGPDHEQAAWAHAARWFPLAAHDGDDVVPTAIPGAADEHSSNVERSAAQILAVLRASLPQATSTGRRVRTSQQIAEELGVGQHIVARVWQQAGFRARTTADGSFHDPAMPARVTEIKEALHWYDSSPPPDAAEVVASLGIEQEGYLPPSITEHTSTSPESPAADAGEEREAAGDHYTAA